MRKNTKLKLESLIRRIIVQESSTRYPPGTEDFLRRFINRINDEYRLEKLFDPVQDFGVYGVSINDYKKVVTQLKEIGASKFRIVKPSPRYVIVCFSAKKIRTT